MFRLGCLPKCEQCWLVASVMPALPNVATHLIVHSILGRTDLSDVQNEQSPLRNQTNHFCLRAVHVCTVHTRKYDGFPSLSASEGHFVRACPSLARWRSGSDDCAG